MENNLRILLAKKEISVSQLSRMCGVSRVTLGEIYHQRANPTIETVKRICDCLNCNYCDFFRKE